MIEWKNGYGRSRWQPVRCDGATLTWDCGLLGCIKYWHEGDPPKLRDPKVYRWQWQARLRERIGSWLYRRSDLKQIFRVVEPK